MWNCLCFSVKTQSEAKLLSPNVPPNGAFWDFSGSLDQSFTGQTITSHIWPGTSSSTLTEYKGDSPMSPGAGDSTYSGSLHAQCQSLSLHSSISCESFWSPSRPPTTRLKLIWMQCTLPFCQCIFFHSWSISYGPIWPFPSPERSSTWSQKERDQNRLFLCLLFLCHIFPPLGFAPSYTQAVYFINRRKYYKV